jgi:tetratricopeptide (TPR) repeat protein
LRKTQSQRALTGIFLLLLFPAISIAQEDHQHHETTEKIGKVRFAVSCSTQAQRQFNRALAWLHSFEYEQSEAAFNEVAKTDPQCAMAHWGAAMSLYHQLWVPPNPKELEKATQYVQKAKQIGAKTKRERDYIDAIAQFFDDWGKVDHPTRAARYEQAMETIYRRYPGDHDAAVFYALALNATALATSPVDKTYAKQKRAAALLNRALRVQPEHPGVTHYLIHSYDYPPVAHLALAAARHYAKIAPSSAHALHMPSHIFTRLGLWDEGIATNIRSGNAAKDYALRNHLKGAWDEQLHAMDYLAYAYLQRSRDREARAVLEELKAIRRVDPETFKVAYSFAAIPARWALERRKWSEAAELKVEPAYFPWQRFQSAEAITHYARAIGAARTGDTDRARVEVEKLAEVQRQLIGVKDSYDWATQVEIQRRAAAAWLAKAEGFNPEALRLMRLAADLEDSTDKHPVTPGAVLPARELLGDMLLEVGRPAEALKEYETSLQISPNRFGGLYGAGRAAELAKDLRKAREYYLKLIALCAKTDGARPELLHARKFLDGNSR